MPFRRLLGSCFALLGLYACAPPKATPPDKTVVYADSLQPKADPIPVEKVSVNEPSPAPSPAIVSASESGGAASSAGGASSGALTGGGPGVGGMPSTGGAFASGGALASGGASALKAKGAPSTAP